MVNISHFKEMKIIAVCTQLKAVEEKESLKKFRLERESNP